MKDIFKDTDKNKLVIVSDVPMADSENKSSFREKMLQNNRIEGLLEFRINVTDNEKKFEYDTEGMETLDSMFERTSLDNSMIKTLLRGIANIVVNGEKYMLDEMDYILDPEYIYIRRDHQPQIAYFPGYGKSFRNQIGNLAEYIMNRTDYHDQAGVLTIYTVYMKSREEGFGVRELLSFLSDGEKNLLNEVISEERKIYELPVFESENDIIDLPKEVNNDDKKKNKPASSIKCICTALAVIILIIISYKMKLMDDRNGNLDPVKAMAIILAGAGVYIYVNRNEIIKKDRKKDRLEKQELITENVDDEATECFFDLNRAGSGSIKYSFVSDSLPRIPLNSFPFYIGKDREHMDYYLNEPGISRYHLKVDFIEGKLYVSDLNSTNGSFLNGKRLEPNKPELLIKGDEVRLGRCEYRFE